MQPRAGPQGSSAGRVFKPDDPDRLAALRRYAGIQQELRPLATRVASGAARVTNTAIGVVFLVGNTSLRVVAVSGFDVDPSPRPLPTQLEWLLPDGFVQSSHPHNLQILNALLSSRAGDPETAFGFQAAVPIRSPDGCVLGSLCVLDPRAKVLDQAAVTALEAVAESFESEIELCLDLWNLKRAGTQANEETEKIRLEQIIESSNEAIISETLEGTVTSWNAAAERIFGHTAREAIGRNIALIIPGGNEHNIRANLARLAAGERVEPFETCRLHKNGHEVPVRVSLSPIFGGEGRVIGASSFTADISDHKRTQEVLVRTEARLRAVMTTLPVVVFAVDFEGRFTLCEGRDLNAFGLRQGQLFGESIFKAWAQHPTILEATRRALAGETFTVTLDLNDRALECWFSPLRETGGHNGATAIATDITERRRNEQQLALLRTSIEGTSEGVIITDAKLDLPGPRILYVNPAFARMTGYSSDELVGQSPRILQGPDTDRAALRRLRSALTEGQAFSDETLNYRKDGTTYTVEWRVTPVHDAQGQITHFVALQRDITERKRVASVLAKVATMIEHASDSSATTRTPGSIYSASERELSIDLGQIEAQLGSVRSVLKSDVGLQGRLEEVGGAGGLVQMLALIQSDGVLHLGDVNLHLQSGRIAHVEHSNLPPLDAIIEVFALESGRFAFNATPTPVTPTINFDPTMLALEAARRTDEVRRNSIHRIEEAPEERQTQAAPSSITPNTPSDSEGVIVLANAHLALEFVTGVGGIKHFKASLESNLAWGGNKVVLHGRGLKIVVLNGTLNDWASVTA